MEQTYTAELDGHTFTYTTPEIEHTDEAGTTRRRYVQVKDFRLESDGEDWGPAFRRAHHVAKRHAVGVFCESETLGYLGPGIYVAGSGTLLRQCRTVPVASGTKIGTDGAALGAIGPTPQAQAPSP